MEGWSKALVRHGADPSAALGEVLGMSAEHIRVRKAGEPEPLLTANTVLSPPPQ
jgi:hypothetical protein